jgi:hypothetical protein
LNNQSQMSEKVKLKKKESLIGKLNLKRVTCT